MSDNPAGWQPDPTGRHEYRYWDGSRWTDDVSDGGVASTDAYAGDAGETPAADLSEPRGSGDPTSVGVNPGADVTASMPAPPPGPPPPTMEAGPVVTGDGGPNKKLLIGGGILAVVVIALIAFVALGGDDDGDADDVKAELAAALREDGSLTDDEAGCVADHVVDEIGAGELEGVDFDADEPPPGVSEEDFAAAMLGSLEECDLDIFELGGGDVDDGTTDDTTEDTTGDDTTDDTTEDTTDDTTEDTTDDTTEDTTDPFSDVEFDEQMVDMLADIYEDSFDLDRDQAECLAQTLGDAINSGAMTEEQAMSEFMDYLDDCDISLSELSGGAGG